MSYSTCLDAGFASGVHDARPNRHEHPWLVVDRDGWRTAGCWSRAEARKLWTQWRLQTEEDNVVGEVGDELNEEEDWRYFSDS